MEGALTVPGNRWAPSYPWVGGGRQTSSSLALKGVVVWRLASTGSQRGGNPLALPGSHNLEGFWGAPLLFAGFAWRGASVSAADGRQPPSGVGAGKPLAMRAHGEAMRLVCTRRSRCFGHDLSLPFFINFESPFVWAFRMVVLQHMYMPMEFSWYFVFFW